MTYNYINERRDQEVKDQVSNTSIPFSFAAGIGAIGLGAAIYSTSVAKGGRLISNLIHFLGHPRGVGVAIDEAANVAKSTPRSGTAGVRSLLSSTINIKNGKFHLGPIDLIDDLRSTLEIIESTPDNIGNAYRKRVIEYISRKHAPSLNPTYFTHDLHRVTVGQVLADQKNWSAVIGEGQWSVLKKAKDAGLIGSSNILDRNIALSKAGIVRDLRLSSIFTRPVVVQTNRGPILERAWFLDLFGQGRVISSFIGESRGVAVLGPDKTFHGTRFYVGGNIYGYVQGKNGTKELLLAKNRKLIKADSPLIPVIAAREGNITLVPNKRTGVLGQAITNFELLTGVGRSFSSRPALIERLIVNPYKRFKAITSGEGVIFTHPNKYSNPFSKVTDAALGSDIPEGLFARGAVVPVPKGGQLESFTTLGLFKRLAVLFDLTDDYSVVKRNSFKKYIASNKQYHLSNTDLIAPMPTRGIRLPDTSYPNTSFVANLSDSVSSSITAVGVSTGRHSPKFSDVGTSSISNKFTSIRNLLNYSIYRISSLASESIAGISFAPAKTLAGNLARLGSIPLIYSAAKETAEYVDYLSEEYIGFSPIKTAADLYAKARVLQQEVRESLGIQQSFNWLDKNFPGIVNSEGSTIARSVALPLLAGSYLLGKGKYGAVTKVASALYAAIGGPDPGQSADDLRDEYLGINKVPVRKGAYWGLGYLPLFGGEVDYYDYSWYHKLKTDYKTKSMYGSRSEYFAYHSNILGVPFPTPHNLFGLKNIMNPYRFEEIHSYDRPYAITGNNLDEFPIIGPLLSATIGKLLKPEIRRQMDMPLLQAGLVQRGLDPNTAQMLGLSKLEVSDVQISDPNAAKNKLVKLANIATEPLGVYKFVMEFMGVDLGPSIEQKMATSDIATSAARSLYGFGIGGALGQTEFTRRFLLNDYTNPNAVNQMYNPIRNTMPDWLPGSYSSSRKDQSYYIDFSVGDPFTKIMNGESRLPGTGYEALNALHSSQPGQYDVVDRFLILSDVAPYSQAYRQYEKMVLNMDLEPEWKKKVENAIKYRQEAIGVDTRYPRYEDTLIDLNEAIKDSAIYKMTRRLYDTITHDFLAELPYIGSKLFPFRNPEEQYRKMYVEGSDFASWNRPWEDIIRPAIYDMASVNPLMGAVKGAGLGYILSGPMRWFNPIKSLVSTGPSLLGVQLSSITRGAMLGTSLSTARILAGEDQNFIPSHIDQESDAYMNMSSINYLKYRSLSDIAYGEGQYSLGKKLELMTNRTIVGANTPIMLKSTLPRSADKRYFEYFMSAPEQNRAQIYQGLPGFMKYALSTAWSKDYPDRTTSDQIAASHLTEIPDNSWIGWNADLPIASTNINLIKHGINGVSDNYHRFGFYESQENEILNRIPSFYDNNIEYITTPKGASFNELLSIRNAGYMEQFNAASVTVSDNITSTRNNRYIKIKSDRSKDTKDVVNMYYGR